MHQTFVPELIIKYSKLERVGTVDEIEHPIIREAMRLTGVPATALELSSMADIPAGTGLGSSGSFTTALLQALHAHKKNLVHPAELAEQACLIELDKLKEPIGKQDQYIAAYGGITCFEFNPDGSVIAWPLKNQRGNPLQPGRQPAAFLHRLLALGLQNPQGAGRQEQGRPTRGWWTICTSSRTSAYQSQAKRWKDGTPGGICATDGRTLATQEGTLAAA